MFGKYLSHDPGDALNFHEPGEFLSHDPGEALVHDTGSAG